MNINIKATEDFVIEAISEYCSHSCSDECIFDKLGYCTENTPFSILHNKYIKFLFNKKGGINEYRSN